MPIYEYRCQDCEEKFEQLRRMADADAASVCPKCSSPRVEREWSCFAAGGACGPAGSGFT
jgi:putative FmdB family regulatory protein